MHTLSNLGRKVLEQTNIPQDDMDWLWWVEKRLQTFRINALVQMVQNSKQMDRDYIDGYAKRYKWGIRPETDRIFIADHEWLFYLIQQVGVDFPWGLWSDFVRINDPELLSRSVNIMMNRSAIRSHSYWVGIYKSEANQSCMSLDEVKSALTKTNQKFEQVDKKEISSDCIKTWEVLKGAI